MMFYNSEVCSFDRCVNAIVNYLLGWKIHVSVDLSILWSLIPRRNQNDHEATHRVWLINGVINQKNSASLIGAPNDGFPLYKLESFLGYPQHFKISRNAAFWGVLQNLYLFGHPRGTFVFTKLQGLQ